MSIRTKELLKFILNLIFALYNFALGVASYSYWFITVGAYYIILSIMRLTVHAFCAKGRKNERFIMKFSGVMILILAIILCGIVYLTANSFGAVKYHEIAMITIALYTFIKLTTAICGFIKSGKINCPYIKTIRSISLTDAVVSIYSLQRSMLVSFEGMTVPDIILFNTLTGIGVCIITVCTGLNLITGNEKKNG